MSSLTKEQCFFACITGNIKVLKSHLHENPHIVNEVDFKFGSLLHLASGHGRVELVKHLQYLNNEVCSMVDESGSTPLHLASVNGPVEIVKLLLDINSEACSMVDKSGSTPLHLASANGPVEKVKLLLNKNQDVCLVMDKVGRTPLHTALMVNGRVLVVNELVRPRPEVLIEILYDRKMIAILHTYIFKKGPEALKQLLEVNHDLINSQDKQGNTILHKVVDGKQYEMLEELTSINQTSQSIFTDVTNNTYHTPLDLINQFPDPIMAQMYNRLIKVSGKKKPEVDTFNEIRNAIMVIATLIAAMAYRAGLSPPGGVWDHSGVEYLDNIGRNVTVLVETSVLADIDFNLYKYYWAFNTTAFVLSLSIVLLLIQGAPPFSPKFMFLSFLRRIYMFFLTIILWVRATSICLSYVVAMIILTPNILVIFDYSFRRGNCESVIAAAAYTWMGLICVSLVNISRFLFSVIKKSVKFIKRMMPSTNANVDQPTTSLFV